MRNWGGPEAYEWSSIDMLTQKLLDRLDILHPGDVFDLELRPSAGRLVVLGTVASEDVRLEVRRQLASFARMPLIVDRLVVAATFHPASDDDEWLFAAQPGAGIPDFRPEPADDADGIDDDGHAGSGSPSEAAAVTRFPELRTSDLLLANTTISITADLAVEWRESAAPAIELATLPPGWGRLEVDVLLMAPALEDVHPARGRIIVFEDGRSTPAVFRARIRDGVVPGSPIDIFAVYSREDRILESWQTSLGSTVPPSDGAVSVPVPKVVIVPDAEPPTLSVIIRTQGDGTLDWLWMAPVDPEAGLRRMEGKSQVANPEEFARKLLTDCPAMPSEDFRRRMEKIGEDLWMLAPEDFRSAYLALRKERGDRFPIQIMLDEHSIPWEMMLPILDDDVEAPQPDHLLFTHPIARWPVGIAGSRRPFLPCGSICSFVPEYENNGTLPAARREGRWLDDEHGARRLPATKHAFLDLMAGGTDGVGLVHFAGHGRARRWSAGGMRSMERSNRSPNDHGLQFEDAWVMTDDLSRRASKLGSRDHPVIVLNACEMADTMEDLGWVEGWGPLLADRGFGAIVAPLWRVQDEAAHDVVVAALNVYLKERSSIGAAFTIGRAAVSSRSIASFAFVTYGDVMARIRS